jgi:DNA modification methylase
MENKVKEVHQVEIDEIQLNPKNRNKHPKDQIERLCDIIKYQGFRNPLIISNRSGLLVAGHGRLIAAKKLKLKTVPVTYQDFDSEEQEIAAGVSDNAIALWADLDLEGINADIPDLGPDFDIDLLGIKNFKIDLAENEGLTDPDEVPETPKESPVCRGELFRLGKHRLLCGDSTSITDVERLMNGEKADMVFTDPPYGYKYESNYQDKHKMLENDDKILNFMPCAHAASAENAAIYIFGSHQTINKWRDLIDKHFKYKNLIVWKKNNWSMGDLGGAFAGQHELILFAHKGRITLRGERSRDVWEFDRDPPKDHPTQKPVSLIEFAINKTSDKGMSVLDLFLGSGSTLIACEKTNRQCYGIEIDPHYCSVILDRWAAFTGKDPVRLNDDGTETPWAEIKATLKSSLLPSP